MEDARSSEFVEVTFLVHDDGTLAPGEVKNIYTFRNQAVTEVISDVDRFKNYLKQHPDEHSSDLQQVGRGGSTSGFYKVPEEMRRRAGSEAAALYDPKHVNLWKIRELFEKLDDPGIDDQTRNQLRHYHYHLRSYAKRKGRGDDIEGLIQELGKDFYFTGAGSNPCSYDHLLSSAVLWAHIFLSDLLYRTYTLQFSANDDPECAVLWVSELWADLLLLENQIPLLTNIKSNDRHMSYMISYFADFLPFHSIHCTPRLRKNYYHILDLIHHMLLPMTSRSKPGSHLLAWFCRLKEVAPGTMKPVPTVTRLQQAGIKFKLADEEGFVVEFKRGVLKLPRLHITKCTKKVFMNLIAWEICHTTAPKYFINYAIFMDHLINTSKDVEILIQSGVFEHSSATDEEVATLFNGLSQDLIYTENEPENERYDIFPQLSLDINNYCKSRRNVWWANLLQDYFKSPWSIISLIAALFLILLTLMQTFFSAYSYFRPPK